jgi:hypothetical protein
LMHQHMLKMQHCRVNCWMDLQEIGVQHGVQIITDDATNYVVVSKLPMERHPTVL